MPRLPSHSKKYLLSLGIGWVPGTVAERFPVQAVGSEN